MLKVFLVTDLVLRMICDIIPQICSFINVLLMLHIKCQQKMPSWSHYNHISNLRYVLIIHYNFTDKALARFSHPLTFLII